MQDFQNRVVVITGAASGIGRSIADAFSRVGARLVIADIEEDPLRAAEQELQESTAEVLAIRTDVADQESVEGLAEATLARFGEVDIICNNAGVAQPFRSVWEISPDYWRWFLGINLWGVIHGIRTFVPLLMRQGRAGHIVNTASVAGLVAYPLPYLGAYSAAKHAIVSISESLAAELALTGSPIRVSVLCPGFVRTRIMDWQRHAPPGIADDTQAWGAGEEMQRKGIASAVDPAEIAAQVLDAIREERLYILTHPECNKMIRDHADDLVLQRNPLLSPPNL